MELHDFCAFLIGPIHWFPHLFLFLLLTYNLANQSFLVSFPSSSGHFTREWSTCQFFSAFEQTSTICLLQIWASLQDHTAKVPLASKRDAGEPQLPKVVFKGPKSKVCQWNLNTESLSLWHYEQKRNVDCSEHKVHLLSSRQQRVYTWENLTHRAILTHLEVQKVWKFPTKLLFLLDPKETKPFLLEFRWICSRRPRRQSLRCTIFRQDKARVLCKVAWSHSP